MTDRQTADLETVMTASNPYRVKKQRKADLEWVVAVTRVNEANTRFIDHMRFETQEAAETFAAEFQTNPTA